MVLLSCAWPSFEALDSLCPRVDLGSAEGIENLNGVLRSPAQRPNCSLRESWHSKLNARGRWTIFCEAHVQEWPAHVGRREALMTKRARGARPALYPNPYEMFPIIEIPAPESSCVPDLVWKAQSPAARWSKTGRGRATSTRPQYRRRDGQADCSVQARPRMRERSTRPTTNHSPWRRR